MSPQGRGDRLWIASALFPLPGLPPDGRRGLWLAVAQLRDLGVDAVLLHPVVHLISQLFSRLVPHDLAELAILRAKLAADDRAHGDLKMAVRVFDVLEDPIVIVPSPFDGKAPVDIVLSHVDEELIAQAFGDLVWDRDFHRACELTVHTVVDVFDFLPKSVRIEELWVSTFGQKYAIRCELVGLAAEVECFMREGVFRSCATLIGRATKSAAAFRLGVDSEVDEEVSHLAAQRSHKPKVCIVSILLISFHSISCISAAFYNLRREYISEWDFKNVKISEN